MARNDVVDVALMTWLTLNATLMKATEKEASALLEAERRGMRRRQYMLRIQSRVNRLRRARERGELESEVAP